MIGVLHNERPDNRVGVFVGDSKVPLYRLKPKAATRLVANGRAKIIGVRAIRITPSDKETAVSTDAIRESRQRIAYEMAGSDCHPRFFQGGLTRTEHQPAQIDKFQGAKVGHQ